MTSRRYDYGYSRYVVERDVKIYSSALSVYSDLVCGSSRERIAFESLGKEEKIAAIALCLDEDMIAAAHERLRSEIHEVG